MTIDDKIKDEKLQHNINNKSNNINKNNNKKTTNIALSSGKIINMNILQVKKYCHLIKVE